MSEISRSPRRFTRRDALLAILLAIVVFLLGLGGTTRGVSSWGDDFAAYMSQAIAIADGDMPAQLQRNYLMHLTEIPGEGDEWMYVWGYPLILSYIYRAVGFDTQDYSSVFWYKLPSTICLALCASVFYLLLRRRFDWRPALFLALIFPTSSTFLSDINNLYSDLVFIFFSTLLLLLGEIYAEHMSKEKLRPGTFILSAVLGVVMWYTYETRLNGVTVCAAVALAQLAVLTRRDARRNPGRILMHLAPYALFVLLTLLSHRFLLPAATSNAADVGATNLKKILTNFAAYGFFSLEFLDSLPGFHTFLFLPLAFLCVMGYIKSGFKRENLHLALLVLGTYVVNILLPYRQRHRYLYNILPILILFLGYGGQWARAKLLPRLGEKWRSAAPAALKAAAIAVVLAAYLNAGAGAVRNWVSDAPLPDTDVYSPQAVETYRYIQENTDPDAMICFFKPRALYLNTGRLGWCMKSGKLAATDADYYLWCESEENREEFQITPPENEHLFELEFSTEDFFLYKILPEQD